MSNGIFHVKYSYMMYLTNHSSMWYIIRAYETKQKLLIFQHHIDWLSLDCSNSIANALELLQSCPKPSIYDFWKPHNKKFIIFNLSINYLSSHGMV